MQFDGTEVLIGTGAQAKVYSYQGFAWKVYNKSYSAEWIQFEYGQQVAANKAGLSDVQYYQTDDPHIIKMDLVKGITLEDRINKDGYEKGLEDLLFIQNKVHGAQAQNILMPDLNQFFIETINSASLKYIDAQIKERAKKYLESIPAKKSICHLDLHFLNLMWDGKKYTIIDWMNARLGNPVFDFARTYIIFYEYANMLCPIWKDLIFSSDKTDFTKEEFNKAVYVCALMRLHEHKSEILEKFLAEN